LLLEKLEEEKRIQEELERKRLEEEERLRRIEEEKRRVEEEKRRAEEEKRLVEEAVSQSILIYNLKPKIFERDGIMRENRDMSIRTKKKDLDVSATVKFNIFSLSTFSATHFLIQKTKET